MKTIPQNWAELEPAEKTTLEKLFWLGYAARHKLIETTQFSKSKLNSVVAALIDQGFLEDRGLPFQTGGRKAESLCFKQDLGVVVGVYMGATGFDVAILTPNLEILALQTQVAAIRLGPGVLMPQVKAMIEATLQHLHLNPTAIIAIGVGIPGPIEFASGLLVDPPIMPGWEGFSIREYLNQAFARQVFVDNEVNVLALAQQWHEQKNQKNFLVVKIGTGIGCGIVCNDEIYRGSSGAAGDVGHICVDPNGPLCHCGNYGCVEAMAARPAIIQQALEATRAGKSPLLNRILEQKSELSSEDIVQASREGDAVATGIIQRSGLLVGQMLAMLVNFYNPSHIFIAGRFAHAGPLFLAAIRQSVYQRSLALSTRHLEIRIADLGRQGGVIGAAGLAMLETIRS
jgi:glucokinase-like ROK family protein